MESFPLIDTVSGGIMKSTHYFVLGTIILLAACANTTPIQITSVGKSEFEGSVYSGQTTDIEAPVPGLEKYRVFQQGATGFVSVQNVRSGVEEIANNFCARKGKAMHAVSETASKPPHILGNFPRVELAFQCIDRQSTNPSSTDTDKYGKIAALKKLLDSGALTQQEFETEKAKPLTAP